MLYPPKNRAYSPEPKKTKDLANLPNINSKFTGSGGSTHYFTYRYIFAGTQETNVSAKTSSFGHIRR